MKVVWVGGLRQHFCANLRFGFGFLMHIWCGNLGQFGLSVQIQLGHQINLMVFIFYFLLGLG